jgi:hypothetical protein
VAVWLIENDVTDRAVAPGRLPVAIMFTRPFLAAEGNFPVVVVAAHGLFAVSTHVLALLTALGIAAPE